MSKIMYMDDEYVGGISTIERMKLSNLPMIYTSTIEPTSSDGKNGDVWIVYTAPTTINGEEE